MRKRTRSILTLAVLAVTLLASAAAGLMTPWRQSCLNGLKTESAPPDGLLTLPRDGYEAAMDTLLPYVDVLRL